MFCEPGRGKAFELSSAGLAGSLSLTMGASAHLVGLPGVRPLTPAPHSLCPPLQGPCRSRAARRRTRANTNAWPPTAPVSATRRLPTSTCEVGTGDPARPLPFPAPPPGSPGPPPEGPKQRRGDPMPPLTPSLLATVWRHMGGQTPGDGKSEPQSCCLRNGAARTPPSCPIPQKPRDTGGEWGEGIGRARRWQEWGPLQTPMPARTLPSRVCFCAVFRAVPPPNPHPHPVFCARFCCLRILWPVADPPTWKTRGSPCPPVPHPTLS